MKKFRLVFYDGQRSSFFINADYFRVEGPVYAFYSTPKQCLVATALVNGILSVSEEV